MRKGFKKFLSIIPVFMLSVISGIGCFTSRNISSSYADSTDYQLIAKYTDTTAIQYKTRSNTNTINFVINCTSSLYRDTYSGAMQMTFVINDFFHDNLVSITQNVSPVATYTGGTTVGYDEVDTFNVGPLPDTSDSSSRLYRTTLNNVSHSNFNVYLPSYNPNNIAFYQWDLSFDFSVSLAGFGFYIHRTLSTYLEFNMGTDRPYYIGADSFDITGLDVNVADHTFQVNPSDYEVGQLDGYYVGYSDGYNNGYNAGYDEGLNWGASSYFQQGYDEGYSIGYQQGYNNGVSVDDVTVGIFSGILQIGMIPINFFLSIFNFEILGINVTSFITALLSVCLTVIVVRTVTGKKE